MSATDPLRTWWDALEQGGYQPHGQPYDFRARCPFHGGANGSTLHVFIGADGRAVPHCFACQASPKDIATAAGIDPRDSFPAGHRNARRRQLEQARRSDFAGNARTVANVTKALDELGERWRGEFVVDCPYCHSPCTRLVVPGDPDRRPFVHCLGGCSADTFIQALAGRLRAGREAA